MLYVFCPKKFLMTLSKEKNQHLQRIGIPYLGKTELDPHGFGYSGKIKASFEKVWVSRNSISRFMVFLTAAFFLL